MSVYTDIDPQNDPATIEREMTEAFEERFEGWFPPSASLIGLQTKVTARLHSITRGMGAESRAAMFKRFGEKVAGIPPVEAAPATVLSTWTLSDTAGHTIKAGTKATIAAPNDAQPRGFEVVSDVVVAPGSSVTGVGAVTLRAVIAGAAGNGLTADPIPSDSFNYIESVELVGATSGGVDEEDEDAYLDRLTEDLQLLSLSLIVEDDFAKDARSIPGVARCLCIGGYNPEDETFDNPLVVCDFPVDEDGADLSAERHEELVGRQQAKVPSGVEVFSANPTRTKVGVKTVVGVAPGFEPAAVIAAVEARLAEYLSPAKWGTQVRQGEAPAGLWENATHVYYFELVSEIDRVPGVDRVISLETKKGAGAFAKVDIELAGPAPLAEPGTFEVSAA